MKKLLVILFSITTLYGCVSPIPTTSSCKTLGNAEEGIYNGTCQNGLAHGKGIYYYPGKGRYEGDFIDGYKTGEGTIFYNNGNKYAGKFEKNDIVNNGEGIYTWANGRAEKGSFSPEGKWSAANSNLNLNSNSIKNLNSNKSSDKTCTVNSDGTVTGTDGTVWQLCLYGQTYKDGACIGSPKNVSWYEAMEAARNSKFSGKSDWILPSGAFLNGSINPNDCKHPNIPMEIRVYMGGYKEMFVLGHFWTANTRSRDGGGIVLVTNSKYSGGYNSVFFDTSKSASDFDKGYDSIYAVFVRNAPVSDKDNFSKAIPLVKCDAKCLANRKAAQQVRDRDSVKRGEEFSSGAWLRNSSKSGTGGVTTSHRITSDKNSGARREVEGFCSNGRSFSGFQLRGNNYWTMGAGNGVIQKNGASLEQSIDLACK